MVVVLFTGVAALVVAIVWSFMVAIACEVVAHDKGRSEGLWFLLGLILGALPLVILVFLEDTRPQPASHSRRSAAYGGRVTCPRCGLTVPYAQRCPRCASPLPPAPDSPAGLVAARVDPTSPVTWREETGA